MRVMQVMAGAAMGGAESFFIRLVPALQRAGLDQHVVIRRDVTRAALLRAEGIEPVELRFGGRADLRTGYRLKREIAESAPDAILSWMNRAARFVPRQRASGGGGKRPVHVGRLGGYYDLKYYKSCEHLIGNTPDIVKYIAAQGWPEGRAHYLPNFVDARRASPLSRAKFDTPEAVPLVLALGRLHANKAFDVLLDAMSLLPGAYLWLAGEGPLGDDLRARAVALGIGDRVRFLGWQDDPAPLYAVSDIVAVPSRHEPLGNVVIEAWAQDRPVVAAASQGPAQLIEPDVQGFLAPVDDAHAFAAGLIRVLSEADYRATIVAGGRAAYEAQFTETAVVRRYLDFFAKVTSDKVTDAKITGDKVTAAKLTGDKVTDSGAAG